MSRPLISLLVAAGDDTEAARATIEAARLVRGPRASWELVLMTSTPTGLAHSWLREHVVEPRPAHRLLAQALREAHGTWVAVLGAGDSLEAGGMDAIQDRLQARPDVDVLYTDEQWPGAGASGIFTKPGWVPEYERGLDYLGRLCLLRRSLLDAVGGFVDESAGAEEWDAHLRVVERTDRIEHLALIGLVRRSAPVVDDATWDAGAAAVARHFARVGATVRTERSEYPGGVVSWRGVEDAPLVSVVVPTGGGRRHVHGRDELLVELCARSLVERTDYQRWELVLVPSEGTPDAVVETVREIVGDRLVVAPADGPFNFSRSVNIGAAAARGELLLLLNDDIDAIEPSWLDRMVSVAADPSVGVVGARLLHEEGLIQHVGIVYSDVWIPQHIFQQSRDGHSHFGVGLLDTDFTATTGACLLLGRALYHRVGGLHEKLPLNYNDVDLCHKVVREGLRVVVTPTARLHHYESSTREAVLLDEEVDYLQRYWRWLAWSDPWVNTRSVR